VSRRARSAALVAVLAILAASCSGSGSNTTGDVAVTLKDFAVAESPGTFAAGDISFGIHNDGPSVHEFVTVSYTHLTLPTILRV
jgi:hypothetical protein